MLKTECVLVIDAGTSSLKATLVGLHGRQLAKQTMYYDISVPHPNLAEQDPRDWWRACCAACGRLMASGDTHVLAICVSGQAPGCVPVKADGSPVRPAILWLDRRASDQVDWLKDRLGVHGMPHAGMNTLDSYFGGVKWLWYRQNEPQRWVETWKILQANSYLILLLTGEAVTDPTHAGICSPCFDFETRGWSAEVCRLMEIDTRKLPEIHPSTAVIGMVSAAAAQQTGLQAGTPVVCGAADFACAYLGSGAGAGAAALMLGTAGNLMSLMPGAADRRMLNTIYFDGQILSTGGVLAGAAVSWFLNMLKIEDPKLLDLLEGEAAAVQPGAENLLFLPYLMGERSPLWDPDARGVYFGLSSVHLRGHLYRALLEGVAHAVRQLVDILATGSVQIDEIVAINGGARSPLWRQIIADVTGVPVRWRPTGDGTTLGAGALAALAAGVFNDLGEIAGWLEPSIDKLPDMQAHAASLRHHRVYCQLYDRLKESFRTLQGPV